MEDEGLHGGYSQRRQDRMGYSSSRNESLNGEIPKDQRARQEKLMQVSIIYQFNRIWFKSLTGVSPCKSRSLADNAVYAARNKHISSRYHFDLASLCRRTHHPPHKSPLGARISYPKPHLSIQTTTPSHPRHTLTSPHPPIKQIPNLPVRLHLLRPGPSRFARATDIRLAGHASHIEAIHRFLGI